MTRAMLGYIRVVDAMNRRVGRVVMYGIFVMMGILLWSSVSKVAFLPALWTLETAQFAMVAFYMLGGPYAIQMGSNVRMDLFYGSWSDRQKAWVDAFTVMFLLFYLGVLLYGGLISTSYSLGDFNGEPLAFFGGIVTGFVSGGAEGAQDAMGFLERSPTAWRPYLWPIKTIMVIGIFLMILQGISEFFKDILRIRGHAI